MNKIATLLKEANSLVIYPHIQIDGDALGSAVALCIALRKLGKKAEILIEDKVPNNISFLDKDYCVYKTTIKNPDLSVAVDSSDEGRLGERIASFNKGKLRIQIDHHKTATGFGDYNYVDAKASSTGEIIMDILKLMEVDIDQEIGEALYTAIVTDTGRFMYSNTSKKTHLMVAELFDRDINHVKISNEIYQSIRLEKIKLENEIMSTLEIFHNGKACLAYMTEDMLERSGAYPEETEGIVEKLRNIEGIEIAAFLREENQKVKGTFRSKGKIDVSKIAMNFGGGGHNNAAGCVVEDSIEDFKEKIRPIIEEELSKWKVQE